MLLLMVAAITFTTVLINIVENSEQVARGLVWVFVAVGPGGVAAFIYLNLAGFVLLGIVSWGLLRLLGRRYRLKQLVRSVADLLT